MASEYWMRSLVPMEKKSHSRASRSAAIVAAGVSSMMPTGMRSATRTPSRISSCRMAWICPFASRSSPTAAIIGSMMRSRPSVEARHIARTCVRNSCGWRRVKRIARSPIAGFGSCERWPMGSLSPPRSSVRMTTGRSPICCRMLE